MEQSSQNNQAQFDRICQKMKRLLVKKQNLIQAFPQEVIPNIFISNYAFAMDKSFLTNNNIALVVTCVKIQEKDRVKGISYKQILIKDKPEQKISQYFDQVYQAINNCLSKTPEQKCLINCFSGKSRSSALVISYLIKSKRISFQQAYEIVKKKYSKSQPNSGFVTQLKQYEKKFKLESGKEERKQSMSLTQSKQNKKENQVEKEKIIQQTKIQKEKQLVVQVQVQETKQISQVNQENSIPKINPIDVDQTNEINLTQKEQNQKFQILENQRVEQKISSQNSAEESVPVAIISQSMDQNINENSAQEIEKKLDINTADNLSQQEILEEKQKVEQKFQSIQTHSEVNVLAQDQNGKISKVQEQIQQKKQQVLEKQEIKSENEQKNEVAASSEPRKKKKKNKKKKLEN